MRTTRRSCMLGAASVLVTGCGTGGGAPVREPGETNARLAPRRSLRSVVVVGAGLAGLATAHALAKHGVDVIVLEAQTRAGGRILTLRSPFSEGLHVEAGATHVVGDPDLLALVSSLGLPLVRRGAPGLPSRGVRVVIAGGKRLRLRPDEEPPRQHVFSPREEELGFLGRLHAYFDVATRFDPRGPWPPPDLARSDRQSAAELMTELGASPGFIEDFGTAMLGEDIREVSGAFVMREMAGFFRDLSLEGGGRIEGGTDRLPMALVRQLGPRVLFDAEVKRIEHDARGVRVSFVRGGRGGSVGSGGVGSGGGGRLEHLDAERVVCAIPFSVLRHVEMSPGFSPAKRRAIHELPMVSVARVFAQVDQRLWATRGEDGDVETDLPSGSVRDETKLQPGPAGVLGAYLSNHAARRMTALPDADRLRTFMDGAEHAHPGVKQRYVAGVTKCWDEDPFARGAYAWFRPNQMSELGPAMASAEGRVHFAGDHTSHRPGWMHGALASSTRVVRELLAALRV